MIHRLFHLKLSHLDWVYDFDPYLMGRTLCCVPLLHVTSTSCHSTSDVLSFMIIWSSSVNQFIIRSPIRHPSGGCSQAHRAPRASSAAGDELLLRSSDHRLGAPDVKTCLGIRFSAGQETIPWAVKCRFQVLRCLNLEVYLVYHDCWMIFRRYLCG